MPPSHRRKAEFRDLFRFKSMGKNIYNMVNNGTGFFGRLPRWFRYLFCVYIAIGLLLCVGVDTRLNEYLRPHQLACPSFLPGIAAALLFFAAVFALRGEEKRRLSERGFFLVIIGFYALLLLVQLFISYHICFIPGWDVGVLTDVANDIANHNGGNVERAAHYFGMYPNNLVLLYIFAALYKVGSAVFWRPYVLLVGMAVGAVWLSLLLATLCVYKLTGSRRTTVVCTMISAALIGLSPWITVPYSDSIGMFFPTAALFSYLYCRKPAIRYFLAAFFSAFGRFIKPTALIFFIALMIIVLCRLTVRRQNLKRLFVSVAAIAFGVATAFGARGLILSADYLTPEPEEEFGISHFLMMGLNPDTNGVFSGNDVEFSESFPTKQERKQANLSCAAERLNGMGVSGCIKLFARKTIQNYNDGSFGWGREGDFYYILNESQSSVREFLRDLFYDTGENWQYLAVIQQTLWFVVLIGCIFCVLPSGRDELGRDLIALTLLGLSAFLLLFECRARYLYIYSPFFAMLFACGLHSAALRVKGNGGRRG